MGLVFALSKRLSNEMAQRHAPPKVNPQGPRCPKILSPNCRSSSLQGCLRYATLNQQSTSWNHHASRQHFSRPWTARFPKLSHPLELQEMRWVLPITPGQQRNSSPASQKPMGISHQISPSIFQPPPKLTNALLAGLGTRQDLAGKL